MGVRKTWSGPVVRATDTHKVREVRVSLPPPTTDAPTITACVDGPTVTETVRGLVSRSGPGEWVRERGGRWSSSEKGRGWERGASVNMDEVSDLSTVHEGSVVFVEGPLVYNACESMWERDTGLKFDTNPSRNPTLTPFPISRTEPVPVGWNPEDPHKVCRQGNPRLRPDR